MKAKFRLGSLEIEVDGDAAEIVELAQSLSKRAITGLALPSGAQTDERPPAQSGDSNPAGPPADEKVASTNTKRLPDARHFFSQHSPTNNREATAVAAYYLKHEAPPEQRSSVITKEALEAVFHEARWKLPKRLDQTLVDTASAGYIKRAETGKYELTNVGHNLVIHTLTAADASQGD